MKTPEAIGTRDRGELNPAVRPNHSPRKHDSMPAALTAKGRIMLCPECGNRASKFGKDRHGLQRYRCAQCNKTFTEPHALAGRHTSIERVAQVFNMLLEGMSVRACERLLRMGRNTIIDLMVEAGEACQRFMESQIINYRCEHVEVDEQWAFVAMKRKTAERLGRNQTYCGDRYVFTGIDRESKLLICWHAGKRDDNETWHFADKLYRALAGRPNINTDGFKPYTNAIPLTFRGNIDYAQIIKNFQSPTGREAAVRYSPGSITSITKTVICGQMDDHDIGTSRMERFNLTTRMQVRRFTRLTNAHSKKVRNHDAMLGLYFAWYNWCRKHSTIKTTPAVKAGFASEPWTLAELLTVAAAV